MLKPLGYATFTDPDASRPVEYDTVTCAHCGGIIFVKPNTASTVYLVFNRFTWSWEEIPGAGCYTCGYRAICLSCYDLGVCTPFEKWLDEKEGTRRPGRVLVAIGG